MDKLYVPVYRGIEAALRYVDPSASLVLIVHQTERVVTKSVSIHVKDLAVFRRNVML